MKIKLILLFLLFLFIMTNIVSAKQVENIIYVEINGDNLTISNKNTWWFINTSSNQNMDLTNKFNISSNSSIFEDFMMEKVGYWNIIKDVNVRLNGNVSGLSANLLSCELETNPKCFEQKDLYNNKTKELETCKTNAGTKETQYTTCSSTLTTCTNDKENMYPKNYFMIVGGGGLVYYFYTKNKKYAKTSEYSDVNQTKGTQEEGINEKKLDEAFRE